MPAIQVDLPIEEAYGTAEKSDWELDKEYFAECTRLGFNRAAVVVLKSEIKGYAFPPHTERRWGIIIQTQDYRTYQVDEMQNLKVFWCAEGKETWHHANELYMLNPAPDFQVLCERYRTTQT